MIYKKSEASLFSRNALSNTMKMKAELNEHRYNLERNIKLRTELLLKRIAVLETCNATLCDKLAVAHQEIISLKQRPVFPDTNSVAKIQGRTLKLHVMNNMA